MASVLSAQDLQALAKAELASRKAKAAAETKARAAAAVPQLINRLRRTFTDSSQSFSVDAIIVGFEGASAILVRADNGKIVEVPLSRLSASDRQWIEENASQIQLHGRTLIKYLQDDPDRESPPTGGNADVQSP